jgi:hypothetical protein
VFSLSDIRGECGDLVFAQIYVAADHFSCFLNFFLRRGGSLLYGPWRGCRFRAGVSKYPARQTSGRPARKIRAAGQSGGCNGSCAWRGLFRSGLCLPRIGFGDGRS